MPSSATCMQIEINPIRSWWSPSIIVSAITELPTESRTLWSGADGVLTMQAEKRQKNKAQVILVAGKHVRLDVYVWECVNGPVPPRYGVIHLDNDMRNNAISNLAVAPLIVRSMFVKAGFDSVPAAFSPALYASLILKRR